MTTLATMKSRIADELSRADLTSQIANAVGDAIALYQTKRFYFNETGAAGETFQTVADQETYDGFDDPTLPWLYDIDDIFVVVGVNNFRIKRIDPTLYRINQMPNFKGQPYQYAWQGRQISFAPIPNKAYTIIVHGQYKISAPMSDGETGNPWMTDAERLIRQCAKRMLYQDVILDADAATACLAGETEAYDALKATSAGMSRNGYIQPMEF